MRLNISKGVLVELEQDGCLKGKHDHSTWLKDTPRNTSPIWFIICLWLLILSAIGLVVLL